MSLDAFTHTKLSLSQPGRLPKVQGMGWYMEEANIAQIPMNLVDFEVTGIHTAYEECCNKAEVVILINDFLFSSLQT